MNSFLLNGVRIIALFFCTLLFAPHLDALTVDEIIRLTEAGVSDRTIEMLMKQEKETREGKEGLGVKETLRPDGGKDRTYYSVTTLEEQQRAQQEEREKMEKALEILRNVIIDERSR